MRTVASSLLIAVCICQSAYAESCKEKFERVLINGNGEAPAKIVISQEIVGSMKSVTHHYNTGDGNWMSEVVEPANLPWTLLVDDVMYSSADNGASWQLVRKLDSDGASDRAKEQLRSDAKSATDVTCGSETAESITYETIEGNYQSSALQGAAVHVRYWIRPENGWIARQVQKITSDSYTMNVDQLIEPAPDLELPKPD